MTALLIGALLGVAALAAVLYPLVAERRQQRLAARRAGLGAPPPDPVGEQALVALREIEFDRATGKLSDADYAALKATYTRDALAVLGAPEPAPNASAAAPSAAAAEDELEALIARYRGAAPACPEHGPRPEPDALYCSTCGRYLPGACPNCGAAITQIDARFCPSCGSGLTG